MLTFVAGVALGCVLTVGALAVAAALWLITSEEGRTPKHFPLE